MKLIDRIDSILKEDLATLPSLDSGVGASAVPDEFDVEMEPIEETSGQQGKTILVKFRKEKLILDFSGAQDLFNKVLKLMDRNKIYANADDYEIEER